MKKRTKDLLPFLAATSLAGSVIFACTRQDLSSNSDVKGADASIATDNSMASTGQTFNKAVGAPIATETAKRWIDNYIRATGHSDSYKIEATTIQRLLDHGAVGISMHYARDSKDQFHILLRGVDVNGRFMADSSYPTANGDINWATAEIWMGRYKGPVKSHYMGTTVLDRLLKDVKDSKVLFTTAINDSNTQQLLLSDADTTGPIVYFDNTWVCPPVCPTN